MNYIPTKIKKVWIIGLKVFKDARGYFFEVFKKKHIRSVQFIQNNESKSLKGLHYQKQNQGIVGAGKNYQDIGQMKH